MVYPIGVWGITEWCIPLVFGGHRMVYLIIVWGITKWCISLVFGGPQSNVSHWCLGDHRMEYPIDIWGTTVVYVIDLGDHRMVYPIGVCGITEWCIPLVFVGSQNGVSHWCLGDHRTVYPIGICGTTECCIHLVFRGSHCSSLGYRKIVCHFTQFFGGMPTRIARHRAVCMPLTLPVSCLTTLILRTC
jgi:hypothetical protein